MKTYQKILAVLLATLMLLALAACGGADTLDTSGATDWTLTVNGKTLQVGMDMPKDLGEPTSYFESASCAIEGLDKDYTYGSILVRSEDDGKNERIVRMTILDDGATTVKGATIGSSRDAVIAAHGQPTSESATALTYEAGAGSTVKFLLRDGTVTSIVYAIGE